MTRQRDELATPLIGSGGGGGGKGGGGGQRTPTTTGDNLNSTQYAQVLDLLSEGEIQGLKDGLKSIYLDNTPLQNADGSFNFRNVSVVTRNGTQAQAYIPGFTDIENEVPVGVTVTVSSPVTRTITDTSVNAARLTITVPQLQKIEDNGDINGTEVLVVVQVQYNGGGYAEVLRDIISGRTGDAYQRDYLVALNGTFPVDIRVLRGTPDSSDPRLSNAFSWSSYTQIKWAALGYPNSALVALRVDAEQFNRIPQRSYLVRGIKVRIPSNATVDSTTGRLIYAGVWNGTFGAAQWTSDPAWILYDLLLAKRYGFGDYIDAAQLDKFSFYTASVYASALVPDGFGGQEPRFSCNVNIQTAEDAYKLINDLCSVFRVMPYWSTGALSISQDAPSDPAYLFSLANVTEEGFSYAGSSLRTRPTVAIVSYLDLELRDIAKEVVEDQALIAKYGYNTVELSAFACTSRGQASRLGKWYIYSEAHGEVINFTTSVDAGVVVRPGQIIEVADPVRAGDRRAGRISTASTTVITVDDASGLYYNSTGVLSIVMPDGTLQSRPVTSFYGSEGEYVDDGYWNADYSELDATYAFTVSPPFTEQPNANSIWGYETSDLLTSLWRVLAIQEQDGTNYAITALEHNPSKYAFIEQGLALQIRDTTNLNEIPAAPINLQLTEALYLYQSQVRAKVIASWKPVKNVNQYQVRWRKDKGNWQAETRQGPDIEILDITPGTFEFEIYSVNSAFKPSTTPLSGSINALGKTAPPSDVTGLTYTVDPQVGVTLTWTQISDIDLDFYEIRRGTTWASATVLAKASTTYFKIGYLDAGTYTYLVKAVDTSGVNSVNAASVAVTTSAPNAAAPTVSVQDPVAVLSWAAPAVTSYAIDYYEVSWGTSYGSATLLTKSKSTSFSVPVTWSGTRTFYVVPYDLVGKPSATQGSVAVSITPAAAPAVTAVASGSTATLSWGAVNGTLQTRTYQIRQGATFATATIVASLTGTSYAFKADWSGSRTYWVVAVDANGNLGTEGSAVLTIASAPAPTLSATFAGQDLVLTWTAVSGTLDTDYYVVRQGATTVATIKSTAYTLKASWSGAQQFSVAAVDVNGLEGTAATQTATITPPSLPTISQQVIDNNVLLRWNDVTQTLPILSYELRRGADYATAAVIGTKQGGFTTVFETASGTYVYWLVGIDSAGNYGTPNCVRALVSQPPDYQLKYDYNSADSSWPGTETNIYTDPTLGQIVNVNTSQTYQQHFTANSYNTPQDQINAGYTYYLMPSTTTASYVEEIDYGTTLGGTKISVTPNVTNAAGSTTYTVMISVRLTTGSAWIDYANTTEVYVTNFRYIKVTIDFTSSGNNDIAIFNALEVRLDVKRRSDFGKGTANSGDSGGTTVNFVETFTDVDAISVTPLTTSAVIAVYDFVDAPNPTSFKVLLFNTSGTRVSGDFSWTARGV